MKNIKCFVGLKTWHWRHVLSLLTLCLVLCVIFLPSCKKAVEIPPPANSITTSEVFADSADAASAIYGVYADLRLRYSGFSFGSGALTLFTGLSSDELQVFSGGSTSLQFQNNTLLANNGTISTYFWALPYQCIYQTNAIIEGLQASTSTSFSTTTKTQFIAEAKFLRALCYFYMTNLFGDVPLLLSTDYESNALASRTPQALVYQQIVSDLKDAQSNLRNDYTLGAGQRIRANTWAATALLARVYLYLNDWPDAEIQSTSIINNDGLFNLDSNLNTVFNANSREAILQWQLANSLSPYNATPEGYTIIPYNGTSAPSYYLNKALLNAFEPGDLRRVMWVDSTVYNGSTYFYPYKYTIGSSQVVVNGPVNQYYMVLRLAEQYLIRAEAEANGAGGGASAAIVDLNVLRNRSHLSNYSGATDKTSVLDAIYHERQVELFAEWGHRWFDLKRTAQTTAVLNPIKPNWQPYQQLYPIPFGELLLAPNLTQNPGY